MQELGENIWQRVRIMFARINGINNIICRGKMAKNAETDMAVSMYDGIDMEKITQEESGEMVGGQTVKDFHL